MNPIVSRGIAFVLTFLLLVELSSAQQAYFQQDIAYEIHVRLDDKNHFLHGFEEFEYTNNSPDTLREMFIHLWPNAYRDNSSAFAKQKYADGSTRFWNAEAADRGYIDSLDIRVDGARAQWASWEGHPDIAQLWLPTPLAPGATITLNTPFRVKIPKSFSRLGRVGQQYQLCQWYPQTCGL